MRMYAPNPQALQALRGSGIELVLDDVPNRDLQRLAIDAPAAAKWVRDNVLNYYPDVKFQIIAVRNEVSTATYSALLSNSYPPSRGSFEGASRSFMGPIISFLRNTNNPLLVNIYPYFAHINNPHHVPLPYAMFTAPRVVVRDSPFHYKNLFDAMLDATYSALEKAGRPKVEIVVSESGWPSAGGPAASVENAGTYYRNLINHVKGRSPKTPGRAIETYLFAMFDENQKIGAQSEKHFGLFSPNKQPKYQLSFD
ncbi:hypothetical protein C3L33_04823, partial [Rhododendron williamsianum]